MTARDSELDRAALEALFMKLEKPLFNVVYRWVWSAAEAEELVQETFLKLWARRAWVVAETAEPLAFRVALNLAANRARRRRWLGWLSGDDTRADERPTAEAQLAGEQTRRRVRAAIDALPEKLRAVVVLTELSGLSYAAVAQTLGVPVGTVGSRRSLALAALQRSLGEPLEGFAP